MNAPQIDVTERHHWRIESCGCIFDAVSGDLRRGCRRHDPQVAGRIVLALEAEIRALWGRHRWGRKGHQAAGQSVRTCDTCLRERHELRTLLRIRRAGRA